ncbi:hypothetical protein RRG08_033487 [Elysia crispata]|uniref:Uncharacterized protein n=1 Tax=Elysia crispata TaxID=231223 RepID=A0AAE1AV71_9GAST|nr:hypothetical protein RRG08_033487 [Elysia crispata]
MGGTRSGNPRRKPFSPAGCRHGRLLPEPKPRRARRALIWRVICLVPSVGVAGSKELISGLSLALHMFDLFMNGAGGCEPE